MDMFAGRGKLSFVILSRVSMQVKSSIAIVNTCRSGNELGGFGGGGSFGLVQLYKLRTVNSNSIFITVVVFVAGVY